MSKYKLNKKENGAALLLFVLFFMATSLSFTLTIGKAIYDEYTTYQFLLKGKESFFAVEAALDDAVYRYRDTDLDYSSNESFTINGIAVNTTVTVDVATDEVTITAEADNASSIRRGQVDLVVGTGVSFSFGLQSGNGGIRMLNTSGVIGNIFSNGQVIGSSNSQNNVYGSIVSAGNGGLVKKLHATGTVRSHSIDDAVLDEDAYYFDNTTITSTLVGGSVCPNPNCHPGSSDKAPRAFPISADEIIEWEEGIEDTGTVISSSDPECAGGTYIIDFDTTINNLKVECNLTFKKQGASTEIILEGPLWVVGDLNFEAGPTIIASSSLGDGEVHLIVDTRDASAPYDTGLVSVESGTSFESGSPTSYIFLISMNKSAEEGGTEKAIDLGQTSTGRFAAFAPHGLIEIGQSTSLVAVIAYQIKIFNGAQVVYEEGLADSTFEGTGGGYSIVSWLEI